MRSLELHYLSVIVEEMLTWSSWVTSLVVSAGLSFLPCCLTLGSVLFNGVKAMDLP